MSPSDRIAIVWFRRDLRLDDNPAWASATSTRDAVVPLYVLDPRLLSTAGPYRRRYLVASLQALDYDLFERFGGRLLVRVGDPTLLVPEAAEVLQAGAVHWNGDTTPFARRRDDRIRGALDAEVVETWGTLVRPPGSVVDDDGRVPRVFTRFAQRWTTIPLDPPADAGDAMVYDDPGEPLPRLDGRPPLPEGEGEAAARLEAFLERVDRYGDDRHRLDLDATSHLSADLRFGVLSPRAVVDRVGVSTKGRRAFVRQIAWRDWYAHLLGEEPGMATSDLDPRYAAMTWRTDPQGTSAWKGGFTGYPVVDAAMRQLRDTGWLPNRARLIAASFLTHHLLVDWRVGEQHFRHLLVDADVAQDVGNWQWTAGVGLDAASGGDVRILDPVAESRRWDPTGAYIRRWVPELAELADDEVHAPWELEDDVLAERGLTLGTDYPHRVVDHEDAVQRARAAHAAVRGAGAGG